jgi:hypothetical protein
VQEAATKALFCQARLTLQPNLLPSRSVGFAEANYGLAGAGLRPHDHAVHHADRVRLDRAVVVDDDDDDDGIDHRAGDLRRESHGPPFALVESIEQFDQQRDPARHVQTAACGWPRRSYRSGYGSWRRSSSCASSPASQPADPRAIGGCQGDQGAWLKAQRDGVRGRLGA